MQVVYDILRRMYCLPFFHSYEMQRLRMGDQDFWHMNGFHSINEGIDFVQACPSLTAPSTDRFTLAMRFRS